MNRIVIGVASIIFLWPHLAQAEEPPPVPDTGSQAEQADSAEQEESGELQEAAAPEADLDPLPRDERVGLLPPDAQERFPNTLAVVAIVDRRAERSPTADRNILVPSAEVLPQGRWVLSSQNLFVNFLSYGWRDDVSVSVGVKIPTPRQDFISTASAKIQLEETDAYALSVQPFAAYSNGIRTLDTSQMGLGAGLLFDWKVFDRLVVHLGTFGFANLLYTYNERDLSNCGTRSGFEADCLETTTEVGVLPSGGHWLSASSGLSWFVDESFSLHAEIIIAGVAGTFFGLEDNEVVENGQLPEPVDRSPFEEPTFELGFPHGAGPTWSLGMGYADTNFAMHLDVVVFRNEDSPATQVIDEGQEWRLLPVASIAYAF